MQTNVNATLMCGATEPSPPTTNTFSHFDESRDPSGSGLGATAPIPVVTPLILVDGPSPRLLCSLRLVQVVPHKDQPSQRVSYRKGTTRHTMSIEILSTVLRYVCMYVCIDRKRLALTNCMQSQNSSKSTDYHFEMDGQSKQYASCLTCPYPHNDHLN